MAFTCDGMAVLDLHRSQRLSERRHVSDLMVDPVSNMLHLELWTISLIIVSCRIFPIHTMTPVWVFPGYPLLLSAPFASQLIAANEVVSENPPINRLAIGMCAIAVQGTGFLISFMICAAFIYRLMTQKLPRDEQRPGVVGNRNKLLWVTLLMLVSWQFISIGPSGFTVAGIGETFTPYMSLKTNT